MAIKRVALSWVGVSDLAQSKKFFLDTLGLHVFESQEEYGWLEVKGPEGNQVLGLGTASPESGMKAGVNAVVTFVTDDYEKTKAELTKHGIKLFSEVAGYTDVPRMICFKDPDGNTFQLVEETPGHTNKL